MVYRGIMFVLFLGCVSSQSTVAPGASQEYSQILEKLNEIQIKQSKQDDAISKIQEDLTVIKTQNEGIKIYLIQQDDSLLNMQSNLAQLRNDQENDACTGACTDVIQRVDDRVAILERLITGGGVECADLKVAVQGVNTLHAGLGAGVFQGYCDQETRGGNWTVIQRRVSGDVSFQRTFKEYEQGFGDPSRNYWIGNRRLISLTSSRPHQLLFNLEDFEGEKRYALYSNFFVDNSAGPYTLHVSGYTGDAGDAMAHHNGTPFSTPDRDNDNNGSHCAASYKGGWWYNSCHSANLNGLYLAGPHPKVYAQGINWQQWHGYHYSLKTVSMAMRPV